MPKFAANLTYLFKEIPFLERFEAASNAGFSAVEVLFPYDDPVTELVRRINTAGTPIVLMCTPPPNWTGGVRGFAAIPGGEDRFRRDFKRSLRFAERLRPRYIQILAGNAEGPEAQETFMRNPAWAAKEAPYQKLTIEPMSPIDMPGYFLNDFELASVVLAEVGAPNLFMQFDLYHAQKITGDAMQAWATYRHLIGHVQISGFPERSEPNKAAFDFAGFFAELDACGYDGYVGAEYLPKARTTDGLGWMKTISKP